MDNGQIFLTAFRVLPCLDGGFVVILDGYEKTGLPDKKWAFSTIADLMVWLSANAEVFNNQKSTPKE